MKLPKFASGNTSMPAVSIEMDVYDTEAEEGKQV